MELPKHPKKYPDRGGGGGGLDDGSDFNYERDHGLNNVFQGSLRETGSTMESPEDENNATASTVRKTLHPIVISVLLIFVPSIFRI